MLLVGDLLFGQLSLLLLIFYLSCLSNSEVGSNFILLPFKHKSDNLGVYYTNCDKVMKQRSVSQFLLKSSLVRFQNCPAILSNTKVFNTLLFLLSFCLNSRSSILSLTVQPLTSNSTTFFFIIYSGTNCCRQFNDVLSTKLNLSLKENRLTLFVTDN